MTFNDTFVSKEERFALGQELESGAYYLSIPVSNQLVDYQEYYEISESEYQQFPENIEHIRALVQLSRERKNDEHLLVPSGSDRGVAS